MPVDEEAGWSREQDIAFENALAVYPDDLPNRWDKIAADVPGKTVEDIKHHYEILVEDVSQIESGCVPLPAYSSSDLDEGTGRKGSPGSESNHESKSRRDHERRKGIAWTEEEHRLFLLGLDKYGKGDWRSISRNFVVTRTPTQVASHAQKFFIRQNSINKDRRRTSIHDITNAGGGGGGANADVSLPQGPITGQNNVASPSGGSSRKPQKQNHQVQTGPPSVMGMYGTAAHTIGQPIAGPLVAAVGTPVNLSGPPPHMMYGVQVPVPGGIVPGAPMQMGPITYPMPHNTSQNR